MDICWSIPIEGRPLRRRRETMLIYGQERLQGTTHEKREDRKQQSEVETQKSGLRTPNPKPQTPNFTLFRILPKKVGFSLRSG